MDVLTIHYLFFCALGLGAALAGEALCCAGDVAGAGA